MSRYQPPLTLTTKMLALIAEISEQLGQLSAMGESRQTPQLRRGNRIRTIQASLSLALTEAAQSEQATDQVTDQVARLLRVLDGSSALKVNELMAEVGLAHKATFRANYLKPALTARLIEMTDPDSPNSPAQRYRLTERGEQAAKKSHR